MGEFKRGGADRPAREPREPRERVESSRRRIRDPLLRERERSDSSSYRMTPADHEERIAVPTIKPPAPAPETQLAPFEPTTEARAPREKRLRQSARSRVSQSLAAAEAMAERVIERAAKAQSEHDSERPRDDDDAPRRRRRAETIAGLGALTPNDDDDDADA